MSRPTLPRRAVLAALAALGAAACGGGRHYVRPNADFSTLRTVTVLPFDNVTSDKLAGERVQRVFLSELLNLGAFDVVEPGLAIRLAKRDGIEVGTLSPDEVKRIGRELKVQAVFVGSLLEFDEGRGGSAASPRVTIQLRLVETETGSTVWSIQRTGGGATVSSRLFGIGGNSAMGVAGQVVRDELAELGY